MFLKVDAGLGMVPIVVHRPGKPPVLRVRVPLLIRKFPRGMGQISRQAATAMSAAQRMIPAKTQQAYDYSGAPGCHIVDLSKNLCLLDDGTEYGCSAIRECDPLTNAGHFEYALPSGATPQPGGIQVGPSSTPMPMKPNYALKNPTTPGVAFTPKLVLAKGAVAPSTSQAKAGNVAASLSATQAAAATKQATDTHTPVVPVGISNFFANLFQSAPASVTSPTASGFDFSFFTNPVSLFGFSVPMWALLAGGGAVAYVALKGKR